MEQYVVSARKYRPSTFDAVIGQSAITTTLMNAVKSGQLAQAYLFTGPRGVGKTTCARIFAKTINCMNPKANGEACEECESCRSFNEGRSLNIHELDAASNNSVDDIRSLVEQVRIPPQVGKYSVYIIDEVHMLSTGAFNAFLKTLEEPPAYAVFILATTERNKILPTILSRCQIYNFNRIGIADTVAHLKKLAEIEGIKAEDAALDIIARKADGAMRDALSIFDQVAGFSQGNITYQKTIEDLNVLDCEYYFRLIDCALNGDAVKAMLILNDILYRGFDGGLLLSGLARHIRDIFVAKDPKTIKLLEMSQDMQARYVKQAELCQTDFLIEALKILEQGEVRYKSSIEKRLAVELSVIRVCQINELKKKI